MIAGIFHQGSGLGDQLMRYITVRTLAEDKGFEWGMIREGVFKGETFMTVNTGLSYLPKVVRVWNEKNTQEDGVDIRSYDPEINFVEDNTIIDGSFEDSKYWGHKLPEIAKWLAVEPLSVPDTTCVIGFRGGEYSLFPDLFLPKKYYEQAITKMRALGVTDFEVHTDDVELAKKFFPDFPCIHDIGVNWRSHRYAKHAVVPNSAFYIIPRLLAHLDHKDAVTLAPRYWARHNTKTWARPACYYPQFTYFHASDIS